MFDKKQEQTSTKHLNNEEDDDKNKEASEEPMLESDATKNTMTTENIDAKSMILQEPDVAKKATTVEFEEVESMEEDKKEEEKKE